MRNKKGVSIFTIDSIVAVSIIAVGIILVFFRISAYEPIKEPTLDAGQNFFTYLSTVRMENAQIGTPPGMIPDITILEQAGHYYHKGDLFSARYLFTLIGSKVITPDMGVLITINNTDVLYGGDPPDDVALLIPFRKIVYGSSTKGEFWSYIIEVQVWQK